MKKTDLQARDPIFALYAEEMARAIRAIPRQKTPPTTAQCASTQRTLDRPKELDEQWFFREIPKEAMAFDVDKFLSSTDEERHKMLGGREIPVELYGIIDRMRKSSKNTLGQSEISATTTELRAGASNAFTYSPPAKLTVKDLDRLVRLTGYVVPEPIEEPKEQRVPWYKRIFGIFKKKDDPFKHMRTIRAAYSPDNGYGWSVSEMERYRRDQEAKK